MIDDDFYDRYELELLGIAKAFWLGSCFLIFCIDELCTFSSSFSTDSLQ